MTFEQTSSGLLIVATDGSALGNPGAGGWSWYADRQCYECGGDPGPVTNNQMEVIAVTRALAALEGRNLRLEVDSQYAIHALTRWHHGWRRNGWTNSKGQPVANRELIEVALDLLAVRQRDGLRTDFVWVRGHVGHERNEHADRLARTQAETARTSGQRIRTGIVPT